MHSRLVTRTTAVVVGLAAALGFAAVATAATAQPAAGNGHHKGIQHVLLISVDGLHQQDLTWYVQNYPNSLLASLYRQGVEYSNAQTPFPSDSAPGMIAQVTGGNPVSTGIYYDDTWNHDVFPAGTTNCSGPVPGGEAAYEEFIDKDSNALDAGQGLLNLPADILQMTGNPVDVINPASLPVDPTTCKPIYPNQYLQVNTIFNVARAHGLRTAWSDKHPAYQMFNGPTGTNGPDGTGVQDYFTPEINSQALPVSKWGVGNDWTSDNAATMEYDSFKVQAILNEIDGFDHSRQHEVGVPAIFGMNFQTVSTAQKLPKSDGLTGGYLPGGAVPGPLLVRALNYINTEVGLMAAEIQKQGLASSTAIIISAKHGQSPTNPGALARVPDGPIIDGINAAWKAATGQGDLVIFSTDDDGMLLWLSDRSQAAADFVKNYLLTHSAAGNNVNAQPITVSASGLRKVYAGAASAALYGVPVTDPRHPDITGIVQYGVVYTGGKKKIAEHGGDAPQDRDVPILVVVPGLKNSRVIGAPVETTQIAPTILSLLGLNPKDLQAVRIEGTKVLPSVGNNGGH